MSPARKRAARQAHGVAVAGGDLARQLPLGLLARDVGERRAHGVDDLAQRVLDLQPRCSTPRSAARVRALRLAQTSMISLTPIVCTGWLKKPRRRHAAAALRVALPEHQVAHRVRRDRVRVEPRRHHVQLRRLDVEPRRDHVAVALERDRAPPRPWSAQPSAARRRRGCAPARAARNARRRAAPTASAPMFRLTSRASRCASSAAAWRARCRTSDRPARRASAAAAWSAASTR